MPPNSLSIIRVVGIPSEHRPDTAFKVQVELSTENECVTILSASEHGVEASGELFRGVHDGVMFFFLEIRDSQGRISSRATCNKPYLHQPGMVGKVLTNSQHQFSVKLKIGCVSSHHQNCEDGYEVAFLFLTKEGNEIYRWTSPQRILIRYPYKQRGSLRNVSTQQSPQSPPALASILSPTPPMWPVIQTDPIVTRVNPPSAWANMTDYDVADGSYGSLITIYGKHFELPQYDMFFNETRAQGIKQNDTELICMVPVGLAPGLYTVYIWSPYWGPVPQDVGLAVANRGVAGQLFKLYT